MPAVINPEDAPPPPWPVRLRNALVRLLVGALLLLLCKVFWFVHHRASADRAVRGQDGPELLARRAYVVGRVTDPSFGPHDFPDSIGTQFQGEWALVSMSMAALALGGMAQRFPDDIGTTESDLEKLIDRALSSDLSDFDTNRWKEPALTTLASPHGHVGYLGHLALILAVDELSFPRSRHRPQLAQITEALARKLDQSPCGLIETYPGELYVPDNAVALAALALASRAGVGPDVAPALLQKLHTRYADPKTGLLPFHLGPGCEPRDRDRASGASWNLLYLGLIDEAYAKRGYEALKGRFLDSPLPGIAGIREWPQGVERPGDIDSGPLLLGLSPAATGFTIASARRADDAPTLQALLDTAEIAGFSLQINGRRRYLLAPLVGDAILLAARAPLRPQSP